MKKKIFIVLSILGVFLGGGFFIYKKYFLTKQTDSEENSWAEVFDIFYKKEYRKYVEQTLGKEIADKYDDFFMSDFRAFQVKLGEKYGLIDAKTGKEITPIKYDDIHAFYDGLGITGAKIGKKWGLINIKGEEITPFKYDNISVFENGLCIVKMLENYQKKFGFINTSGKEVTPIKYEDARELKADGLAAVKLNGKWGFIDENGREIVPIKYDFVTNFVQGFAEVELNGKSNLIGINGKNALSSDYDYISFDKQKQYFTAEKQGIQYVIYMNGRELIPIQCEEILKFDGVFGKVTVNGTEKYIYNAGNKILYLDYEEMRNFSEGLAAVLGDYQWGFVDTNDNEVLPFIYDDANSFENGLAIVKKGEKWGAIDKTGKEIIPIKYKSLERYSDELYIFENGFFNVKNNEELAFDNVKNIHSYDENLFLIHFGEEEEEEAKEIRFFQYGVTDINNAPAYDEMYINRNKNEVLLFVQKNNQWGVVTTNSEVVIPLNYDYIHQHDAYFIVEKDKKLGILNLNNEIILPLKYDEIFTYYEGESEEIGCFLMKENFVAVKKDGKWGVVDLKNNEIIPFKYDSISYDFYNENMNLINVQLGEKWGLIDFKGKLITPIKYDYTTHFYNGLAEVSINEKVGLINSKGKEVLEVKYDAVNVHTNQTLISVKLDKKWGVVDTNGKEIVPIKYEKTSVLDNDIIKALSEYTAEGFEKGYLMDKAGNNICYFAYNDVDHFSDGLAAVSNFDKKYGYIDKTGKVVIHLKYDYAWDFQKGFAPVKLNGKYGLIDKTGKEIVPIKYDHIFFVKEKNAYELGLNEKTQYFNLK